MHRWVLVQFLDLGHDLVMAGAIGQFVGGRIHPRLERRLALISDIDLARRIFADQHHGQARRHTLAFLQKRHPAADIGAQIGGHGLAVD